MLETWSRLCRLGVERIAMHGQVLFKEMSTRTDVPQATTLASRADPPRALRDAFSSLYLRLGLPVFVKPAHFGSSWA